MVKCTVCGVDELLPFKCAYCGESFCPEHRIPEKHGCGGIMLAKSPIERGRAEKLGVDWTGPPMARGVFERREIYHLVAATTLITAAGISLFIFSTGSPAALAISVAGLTLSFLAHELAHKFYAIRIGLTATFRLYPLGAMLTIITSIPFIPIKFIAPGAVHVSGPTYWRGMGAVALAGPAANILISIGLYMGYWAGLSGILGYRLAELNAYLAFFNLLPIGPLDGGMILQWRKTAWVTSFIASILLLTMPRLF